MNRTLVKTKRVQGKGKESIPGKAAVRGLIWLRHYLNEGADTFLNGARAARAAGCRARNAHTFEQIGYRNRKKYGVKIVEWLDQSGLGETQLKIKLLSLMEARETVFVKLRGAVLQSDLPPGHRVVGTTGRVVRREDGRVYGDGESLIEVEVRALETQLRALDMALKMMGLYRPEKHEHPGAVTTTKIELTDADRDLMRQMIDASAKKLMYAGREAVLQLGPGVPQVVAPETANRLGGR